MKRLLIAALIVVGLMPASTLSKAELPTHPGLSTASPPMKRYKLLAPHETVAELAGNFTCQSCRWVSEGCVQCCGGPKHCRPVVEPVGPPDTRPAPAAVKCPAGCYPINAPGESPLDAPEESPLAQYLKVKAAKELPSPIE